MYFANDLMKLFMGRAYLIYSVANMEIVEIINQNQN